MGETELVTDNHTGPESRQRLPRRQRLAGYFLGVATGLGVNELSTDGVGYRGVAVAATMAAILASTHRLRQLPSRAPLIRIVLWVLLSGTLVAAVVAVVSPRWEGPATIAATVLTTWAVLIPADLYRTATLLAGVAFIGVGVAVIGLGVAALRESNVLAGVALIGLGVALIGVGVAVISAGVAALRESDVLAGVAGISVGVALIGLGIAALRESNVLTGVAAIGAGVALIGGGVAALRKNDVLAGVALIGLGVGVIGIGIAALRKTSSFARTLTLLASLTRDPSSKALPHDNPADPSPPTHRQDHCEAQQP